MTKNSRLFLIDGHSYIYRAFFAIRHLSTSEGLPTNAVYGFTTMLLKILRERHPDRIAVVFDSKGPTQRHLEYEDYKADRPEMPDTLQVQLPYISQIVEALGIPIVQREGIEADDLIGTLVRLAREDGLTVSIVSGDKDMLQLVSPSVQVIDSTKDIIYGPDDVLGRFGVSPDRVVDVMGLMGDAIDNIPGVKGIGEKTAVALIQRFGSIEKVIEGLDQIERPKLRESIRSNIDLLRLSRELARIRTNCPLEIRAADLRPTPPDTARLRALIQKLEFGSLLKSIDLGSQEESGSHPSASVIVSSEELGAVTGDLSRAEAWAVHLFQGPYSKASEGPPAVRGVGIGKEGSKPYYIPVTGAGAEAPPGVDFQTIRDRLLIPVFDSGREVVLHNLKSFLHLLHFSDSSSQRTIVDLQVADYLLAPNRRDHSLETLIAEQSGVSVKTDQDDDTSVESQAERATKIVFGLFDLRNRVMPELEQQGLMRVYGEIELPLTPVLARMEQIGIRLDVELLRELSKEMELQISGLREKIYRIAGGEFNINSPKQLAQVLFERLGMKPLKRTKTGYSTSEEVLQQLALQSELPAEILNYRQVAKLKSTYVDALPALVGRDGRLHTSLNQTVAATGRLSSSDPNLQNIPIQGEFAKRIRQAFITDPGWLLLSADYSQIELRVLAHLSGDEGLLKAFRANEDIHTSTAAGLYGCPLKDVTAEMRRTAKTVNFGVIYGISPFGLANTLGVDRSEAQEFIKSYFETFPRVKEFLDQMVKQAAKDGYVTTLFGRRRQIPELASKDPTVRGLGERTAMNSPIQGTAADIIKLAMIRVHVRIATEGCDAKLLLQIHDELLFEVREDQSERLREIVRDSMENIMPISVPLIVAIGVAPNWHKAHA